MRSARLRQHSRDALRGSGEDIAYSARSNDSGPENAAEARPFVRDDILSADLDLIAKLTARPAHDPARRPVNKPPPVPRPKGARAPERAPTTSPPPAPASAPSPREDKKPEAFNDAASVASTMVTNTAPSSASSAGTEGINGTLPRMRAPVVPANGNRFTAQDINAFIQEVGAPKAEPVEDPALAAVDAAQEAVADVMSDLQAASRADTVPAAGAGPEAAADGLGVPERRMLKQSMAELDAWLEEDRGRRGQGETRQKQRQQAMRNGRVAPVDVVTAAIYEDDVVLSGGGSEHKVVQDLRAAKAARKKGEAPPSMQPIADEAKKVAPKLDSASLVEVLKLFASARHEDSDLYLRLLGEIPMQVRELSPGSLVEAASVLRRLRLREPTYMELFSMEVMNTCRKFDRDTRDTGSHALSPFSPTQLVKMCNAASQLETKWSTRVLAVVQDAMGKLIPSMTAEVCEMVHPCTVLAVMNDALKRQYLERCAATGAGIAATRFETDCAAPDINQHAAAREAQRRRDKRIRNVYTTEFCIRKESFSFFSSLPQEVRTHLGRLKDGAEQLPVEESGSLAGQVAEILSQLGVSYRMGVNCGPFQLHIVAEGTNPLGEKTRVYECHETSAYYAAEHAAVEEPALTAETKLRQRLLQRMGVKVTVIDAWSWRGMSEAQRINHLVKLHSFQ